MSASPRIVTLISLPLDDASWSDEWDTSINPVEATAYGHLGTGRGLLLQMYSNVPYGGWLCKNVCKLPLHTAIVIFDYAVLIDAATPRSAQVIETDMKLTDAYGWTYDGSLQFNVANSWEVEIGAPWQGTGIRVPPPRVGARMNVSIAYLLDYAVRTITFAAITVDGVEYPIDATYPATQAGWDKSEIVTQLQQCNRDLPGGYTLEFAEVGYALKDA